MTNKSMNLGLKKILLFFYAGFFFNFYQTMERTQTSEKINSVKEQEPSSLLKEEYGNMVLEQIFSYFEASDKKTSQVSKDNKLSKIVTNNKSQIDSLKSKKQNTNNIFQHNEVEYIDIDTNFSFEKSLLNNQILLDNAKKHFFKENNIFCIKNKEGLEKLFTIYNFKKTPIIENGIITSHGPTKVNFFLQNTPKNLYNNTLILFNNLSQMSDVGYDSTFYLMSFVEIFLSSLLFNKEDKNISSTEKILDKKKLTHNNEYKLRIADKLYEYIIDFVEKGEIEDSIKQYNTSEYLKESKYNRNKILIDTINEPVVKTLWKDLKIFILSDEYSSIDHKKLNGYSAKKIYKPIFTCILEFLSSFTRELEGIIKYNSDINYSNFKNLSKHQHVINKKIDFFEKIVKIILSTIINKNESKIDFCNGIIEHTKNVLKSLIINFYQREMMNIKNFLKNSLFNNEQFIKDKFSKNFLTILNREFIEKKDLYLNVSVENLITFTQNLELHHFILSEEIINESIDIIMNNPDGSLNELNIEKIQIINKIVDKMLIVSNTKNQLKLCIKNAWGNFIKNYFNKLNIQKNIFRSIENIIHKYLLLDNQLNKMFEVSSTELSCKDFRPTDLEYDFFSLEFNKLESIISGPIKINLLSLINIESFFKDNLHQVSSQLKIKHQENKGDIFCKTLLEVSLKKFYSDLEQKIKLYYSSSERAQLIILSNNTDMIKTVKEIFQPKFFDNWILSDDIKDHFTQYWFDKVSENKIESTKKIIADNITKKFKNISNLFNDSIEILRCFITDDGQVDGRNHQIQEINFLKLYTIFRMIDMIDLLIHDPLNFIEKYLNNSIEEKFTAELFFRYMISHIKEKNQDFFTKFKVLKENLNQIFKNNVYDSRYSGNHINYYPLKKLYKNLKTNHMAIVQNNLFYQINPVTKWFQIKFVNNNENIKDFKIINPYLHIDNQSNEYNIVNKKIWIFNKNSLLLSINPKNLVDFSKYLDNNYKNIFNEAGIIQYEQYLNNIKTNKSLDSSSNIIHVLKEAFQFQWEKEHNETFNSFSKSLKQFEETCDESSMLSYDDNFSFGSLSLDFAKKIYINNDYIYKKSILKILKEDKKPDQPNIYFKTNILNEFQQTLQFIKTTIFKNSSITIEKFVKDIKKSQKDLFVFSLLNGFNAVNKYIHNELDENIIINPQFFIAPTSKFKIKYTESEYTTIIENLNKNIDSLELNIKNISVNILKYIYSLIKHDIYNLIHDNSFDLYVSTIEDALNFLKFLQDILLHFMMLNFHKMDAQIEQGIERAESSRSFIKTSEFLKSHSHEMKYIINNQLDSLSLSVPQYNIMRIKSLIERKINIELTQKIENVHFSNETFNKFFSLLNIITIYHDQITINLINNLTDYKDHVFRYNKYEMFTNFFKNKLLTSITKININKSDDNFLENVLYSSNKNNYYHIVDMLKILLLNNKNYLMLTKDNNIKIFDDNIEYFSFTLRIKNKTIKPKIEELKPQKEELKEEEEKKQETEIESAVSIEAKKSKAIKNKQLFEFLRNKLITVIMSQKIK